MKSLEEKVRDIIARGYKVNPIAIGYNQYEFDVITPEGKVFKHPSKIHGSAKTKTKVSNHNIQHHMKNIYNEIWKKQNQNLG